MVFWNAIIRNTNVCITNILWFILRMIIMLDLFFVEFFPL